MYFKHFFVSRASFEMVDVVDCLLEREALGLARL